MELVHVVPVQVDCSEEACSWLQHGLQNREWLLIWKWCKMKYAQWLQSSLTEEPEPPALWGDPFSFSQYLSEGDSVWSQSRVTDGVVGWRGWLEANKVEQADYWESQPHLAPLLLFFSLSISLNPLLFCISMYTLD